MMKLGKVIGDSTEPITLYMFDIGTMTWCGTPITVEFKVEKEPLGTGGFREAYKARSISPVFGNQEWVVKKYLAGAKETIEMTNQTIAQHSKKVVQMHMLARNFASRLEEKLIKNNKLMLNGETLKYKSFTLENIKMHLLQWRSSWKETSQSTSITLVKFVDKRVRSDQKLKVLPISHMNAPLTS